VKSSKENQYSSIIEMAPGGDW